jgi:hypothetical protein
MLWWFRCRETEAEGSGDQIRHRWRRGTGIPFPLFSPSDTLLSQIARSLILELYQAFVKKKKQESSSQSRIFAWPWMSFFYLFFERWPWKNLDAKD